MLKKDKTLRYLQTNAPKSYKMQVFFTNFVSIQKYCTIFAVCIASILLN